ncbi:MAG TPA: hypothetical protein VFU05_09375 [Cyclobacteriaceae bacterium]|nr:hypothetical protein [Cyclobacteriaceae bacterium]
MVRLLSFILAAFIFSCTIIEDSDITSQQELDDLQYVSIGIEQETGSGTTTLLANVTSEKDVSITVPGGKLTKTLYVNWPALGANSKLKLRGGTTAAVRSYTSFLESGKPWTFYFFSSGTDSTILELYSFRYNSNGRLASIISRVPYVAGGPATSNDTLIYRASGELESVTRKFPATGTSVAFSSLNYSGGSDNSFYLYKYIFQGLQYEIPCNGSGCGSKWGGSHNAISLSNNFPVGVMNLTTFEREYLSMQDFNNINPSLCSGGGSNGCNAWIDTFYVHPLMILKDHFSDGDDYLFLYMVDWWKPSPTSPQASTSNEKVTIRFNYDL